MMLLGSSSRKKRSFDLEYFQFLIEFLTASAMKVANYTPRSKGSVKKSISKKIIIKEIFIYTKKKTVKKHIQNIKQG